MQMCRYRRSLTGTDFQVAVFSQTLDKFDMCQPVLRERKYGHKAQAGTVCSKLFSVFCVLKLAPINMRTR